MDEPAPPPPAPLAGLIVATLGDLLLVAAAGLVAFQAVQWLRLGTWPAYPAPKVLADLGIAYPRVPWGGVQKAIDAAMALPAAGLLALLGLALAVLGGVLLKLEGKRRAMALAEADEGAAAAAA